LVTSLESSNIYYFRSGDKLDSWFYYLVYMGEFSFSNLTQSVH